MTSLFAPRLTWVTLWGTILLGFHVAEFAQPYDTKVSQLENFFKFLNLHVAEVLGDKVNGQNNLYQNLWMYEKEFHS